VNYSPAPSTPARYSSAAHSRSSTRAPANAPIDIEVPLTIDLKVVTAEVAVRGDTATGVTKKVKVETGIEVQVPNFVKEGDVIRIDTRNGEYVTRV
jgi:elongation factor P